MDHQLDLEAETSSGDFATNCGGSQSAETGLIKQDRKADVCQNFSPEAVTDGCPHPDGVPAANGPLEAAASDTEERPKQQQALLEDTLNSAASSGSSAGEDQHKHVFMSTAPLSDQVSKVCTKTIIDSTVSQTSVGFSL